MEKLRIAVIGTGVIGQKHIRSILDESGCRLTALVDPAPAVDDLQEQAPCTVR